MDAVRRGVGLVPEDRKSEGLISAFTISENLSLPNYDLVATFRVWLSAAQEWRLATRMVTQLKIDPPIPRWRSNHLSGGNQQKVVLAKWLAKKPKLLLVDEPTHGVDVGAREEIYRVLDDLVKAGMGVIVVSSYLPEVLRISDRILVMRDGRIALEVDRALASEELLLDAATGGAA
jgi:L-arabinose transport system ATP-binding protein